MIAGASGLATAAGAPSAKTSAPELRRIPYPSARTGKERDYFVYLPRGYRQQKSWPLMLFLHGDGERGDAKGELDWMLRQRKS
jgi:predicted peptidase